MLQRPWIIVAVTLAVLIVVNYAHEILSSFPAYRDLHHIHPFYFAESLDKIGGVIVCCFAIWLMRRTGLCPDGTPNLSPKGTTAVWDDDHLVFANIRSPGTLSNLRKNANNREVNVVDPFVRKGYRFKGVASILESGVLYDKMLVFYRERGAQSAIREIVMIQVQTAQPIDSPAYDLGLTEEHIRDRWERHFQSLRAGKTSSQTGE